MTADPPTPPREHCPGSGTRYLPIYDRLPDGREIKPLRSCPGCGRLSMIDARRPWYPAHKREIGRTYESFWVDARLKAAADRATPREQP
jgi:hypothetical protein